MRRRHGWCGVYALAVALGGCGDLWTELPPTGDDFETPFESLPLAFNAQFSRGDENFERVFTPADGLGPIFNNVSCAACHPADGRGTPEEILTRFGADADEDRAAGGLQHQDKAIPGIPIERLPTSLALSRRMPPPVFGVGLIEAIPEATILANADSDDADGDGISGRPNWVTPAGFVPVSEIGGGVAPQLGRFGRKASISSLLEQVTTAYHQDMGITSDFMPVENAHPQQGSTALGDAVADPEIPASTVLDTTMYVRLLAPPARGPNTASTQRGEAAFHDIGCAQCHVPTMRTGPHFLRPLNNTEVHLFSDLLLHDMGPDLADNRPDGDATGREWRTAPLWGTRLAQKFTNDVPYYLHDGRTTDLDEAIRLHGGEAERVRDRYVALPEDVRAALLAFVRSL